MSDSIQSVRPVGQDRRGRDRRDRDRRSGPEPSALPAGSNLPVVVSGQEAHAAPPPPPPAADAAFTAQLIGQSGQRRGLKGGQVVLDEARSAYLETEYSGPLDRRPSSGVLKDTDL